MRRGDTVSAHRISRSLPEILPPKGKRFCALQLRMKMQIRRPIGIAKSNLRSSRDVLSTRRANAEIALGHAFQRAEHLLLARVVCRIDIVKLQWRVAVDLHDDFAGSHRVVMHVGIEIGEAAGGE